MRTRLQALLSGTALVAALATAGWVSSGAMMFANADPITPEQQASLSQAMALADVQTALAALPEALRTQVTQALSNATTTEGLADSIGDLIGKNAELTSQVQTAVSAVVNAPITTPAFKAVSENIKVDVSQAFEQKNITVSDNLQPTGGNLSNVQPAAGFVQQQQAQAQQFDKLILKITVVPGGGPIGRSISPLGTTAAGANASNGQG
ncbi:MAG TPA: hypothetical protein VGO34_11845 [Alphaproteobacteria bacterium]|jgi:hypothetical protein